MGKFSFPISDKVFLFKFIEWVIVTFVVLMWNWSYDFRYPYNYTIAKILFTHTCPSFMVVLTGMMIMFTYNGDKNRPNKFMIMLFSITGAILFTTCGVFGIVNIITHDRRFDAYWFNPILVFINGIIFFIDVALQYKIP